MTKGLEFTFHGRSFLARPSGALYWPDKATLIVADLHLGRSDRYARQGGPLLPPYENALTLARLADEIHTLKPRRVISLGDSFDDDQAATGVDLNEVATLAEGRDWIWISGNHDPLAQGLGHLPGQVLPEWQSGLAFRHIASIGPDVSGHLHPVITLAGKRWRCFLLAPDHLILPAFGSYTGGLDVSDPAFAGWSRPGFALICGRKVFATPLPD